MILGHFSAWKLNTQGETAPANIGFRIKFRWSTLFQTLRSVVIVLDPLFNIHRIRIRNLQSSWKLISLLYIQPELWKSFILPILARRVLWFAGEHQTPIWIRFKVNPHCCVLDFRFWSTTWLIHEVRFTRKLSREPNRCCFLFNDTEAEDSPNV